VRDRALVLHVNGHLGVEGNELADRMSIHGIAQKAAELTPFPVPDDLAEVMAMRQG
jgi:ribonuclease HI